MPKQIIPYCLLLICLATGCVRLDIEYGYSHYDFLRHRHHYNFTPLKNRFYSGTAKLTKYAFYEKTGIATLAYPIALPFELLADTIFIPRDIWNIASYHFYPPLAELVRQKRYEELAERLESGKPDSKFEHLCNPNSIDMALQCNDTKALELFLANGYRPLPHYLVTDYPERIPCLRFLIAKAPWLVTNEDYPNKVFHWCNILSTNTRMSNELQESCMVFIEEMLEYGAHLGYSNEYQFTELDLILESSVLSPENKKRMEALLRKYGGKTYLEMVQENPKLPHLHTEGLTIDPIFDPIIKMLQHSKSCKEYVLSTVYPMVEGPVLVVDQTGKDGHARKMLPVFLRIPPNARSQSPEFFDCPTKLRMIFTKPGVEVPSRKLPGMLKNITIERWMQLPFCSMFWEIPKEYINKDFRDLNSIIALSPKDVFKKYDLYVRQNGCLVYNFVPNGIYNPNELTDQTKEWLARANALAKEAGIPGVWQSLKPWDSTNYPARYAFSTHYRYTPDMKSDDLIAPKPDEVICEIEIYRKYGNSHRNCGDHYNMYSQNDLGYWNGHFVRHYASNINIFFGDAVSRETVEKIEEMAVKAIGQ